MSPKSHWLVPGGLIALSLVPVAAGSARMAQLVGGATVTPANERFFASPLPIVVHIVGITIFSLLGALQFSTSLRRRTWHRRAGRVVVPAGLAAALSGLWMSVAYDLPASDNVALEVIRLAVGTAMVAALLLGLRAVVRRDFGSHRRWMMRGYALGMGAGTQVLTTLPWVMAFGTPSSSVRAALMGAGWAINLAVAEWFIHRQPARRSTARGSTGRVTKASVAA